MSVVRRVVPIAIRRGITNFWLARWVMLRIRNALVIRPTLSRQLSWATVPAVIQPSQARILVPLLQTSHYQYYQILALAKALQLRGAAVRVLICDSVLNGCELKNSRRKERDLCLSCRHNARDLVGLFGLDTVRLSDLVSHQEVLKLREKASALASDYPHQQEYKGVEIIGMTNDSVTRHYYGAVPYDEPDALKSARERYLYSALVGVEISELMHREWGPTALMNDMAVYADWAPYAKYFQQHDIPYNLVTMAPFNMNAVMLNYNELYTATERFNRWCKTRGGEFLNETERQTLHALVDERFAKGGGFEQRLGWFAEDSRALSLGIDKSKRNVFLFTNQAWDVGINYEGTLFDDMSDWVLDSLTILAGLPDTHLFIKTHPEESYGSVPSAWGIEDEIRDRFGNTLPNVTIIPPELKIKAYDLFPFIDLGVVYNSTVGLEMLLKGVPVVTVGAAPYGGHSLSFEPSTKDEYTDVLVGNINPTQPDPKRVELFAYFYLIKSQIPWHLTRQVYFDDFRGFTFNHLDDLLPGKDPHLDHICNCILHPEKDAVEAW